MSEGCNRSPYHHCKGQSFARTAQSAKISCLSRFPWQRQCPVSRKQFDDGFFIPTVSSSHTPISSSLQGDDDWPKKTSRERSGVGVGGGLSPLHPAPPPPKRLDNRSPPNARTPPLRPMQCARRHCSQTHARTHTPASTSTIPQRDITFDRWIISDRPNRSPEIGFGNIADPNRPQSTKTDLSRMIPKIKCNNLNWRNRFKSCFIAIQQQQQQPINITLKTSLSSPLIKSP